MFSQIPYLIILIMLDGTQESIFLLKFVKVKKSGSWKIFPDLSHSEINIPKGRKTFYTSQS